MTQELSTPFSIRYNHEYEVEKTKPNKKTCTILGCVSLSFFLIGLITFNTTFIFFFIPSIFFLILFFVKLFPTKNKIIFLGPRYLIIGQKIIYYQNIINLKINSSKIDILAENNQSYTILRKNFISVSTKEVKKNANLDKKFNQTKEELINRVKNNNSNINIEIK